MAKTELALEVLGQLIAQLRDDAPAISALTPDQQVATSWYVCCVTVGDEKEEKLWIEHFSLLLGSGLTSGKKSKGGICWTAC